MNLSPDFICLSCWITSESECADVRKTKANRAICPRRRLAKANLPPAQMAELQRISKRYRDPKYRLKHLVRMAELQAEWNQIQVGGL